ncbi:hypothetical protein Y032_0056g2697 [Ancylostoma ceylanicum]|uniref:Uncharacterized protein n=1 Tax=Ancylostoma ceylanicum TaxID=53326 RepID=A0A016U4W9_9BILA|nr:hypothetical protein Y032_0056g2697 [Ancylostoma ceylanicum]
MLDSEMREMIVYRFIILLGICDVVEASVHCVTGFALIFPNFWSTSLDNVFGSILVPTYFCYILTGLLLSFVRFMQIVYPDYATPREERGSHITVFVDIFYEASLIDMMKYKRRMCRSKPIPSVGCIMPSTSTENRRGIECVCAHTVACMVHSIYYVSASFP